MPVENATKYLKDFCRVCILYECKQTCKYTHTHTRTHTHTQNWHFCMKYESMYMCQNSLMTSTISVTLPLWAETNLHKLAFVIVYDVKICICVIEGQFDGYAIHETLTAFTHPLRVHQK